MDTPQQAEPASQVLRYGRKAWAWLGILLLFTAVYLAMLALSGLVVPLIVATVLAILCVPVVDRLSQHMPRQLASLLMLLTLLALLVALILGSIIGIADYAGDIRQELAIGLKTVVDWLSTIGFTPADPSEMVASAESLADTLRGAIPSALGVAFAGVVSFLFGSFVAMFLLFYVMCDWDKMTGWFSTHLGVPADLGSGIIDDAVWAIRSYYKALTVTAVIVAVVNAVGAWMLGVPLALVIGVITFATSYIPYLGALAAGAFAMVLALGVGLGEAVAMLLIVLGAQNLLEPIVINRMNAEKLEIHPVVSLGSTLIGGVVAGVLGAMLSAPVVAMILHITTRVRRYQAQ